MIAIKCGKKNLIFSKKSKKYQTNYQEIYKHMKNIKQKNSHKYYIYIKTHKNYLKTFENKQKKI